MDVAAKAGVGLAGRFFAGREVLVPAVNDDGAVIAHLEALVRAGHLVNQDDEAGLLRSRTLGAVFVTDTSVDLAGVVAAGSAGTGVLGLPSAGFSLGPRLACIFAACRFMTVRHGAVEVGQTDLEYVESGLAGGVNHLFNLEGQLAVATLAILAPKALD